jgi:hypothetical protein
MCQTVVETRKPQNQSIYREMLNVAGWAHLFSCYITVYSILKNSAALQQTFPAKATQTIGRTLSFPLQAQNEVIHEKCNSVYLNIFETSQEINSTRQRLKETAVVVFLLSILVFYNME